MRGLPGLSGSLWPVHLKPLPGELLSSLIVRLAHAHGLKVQTFSAIAFGSDKQIWNRDIDKCAPDWLIEIISQFTATSISSLQSTCLKSYEGLIYEFHCPNGNTKWINPIGVYHRLHQKFGLQFCSLCLKTDQEPYYRKQWRLGFFTECEKHHILLNDRCPKCEKPVNFHRIDIGVQMDNTTISIKHCYHCKFDLSSSPIERIYIKDIQTVINLRTLLSTHGFGWCAMDNIHVHYSFLLLEVIRHLSVLISSTRRASRLLQVALENIGQSHQTVFRSASMMLEECSTKDRHLLIISCIWLIQDWPARFIQLATELDLSSAYILPDNPEIPYWFWSEIDRYLSRKQYSPNANEIRSAKAHLHKMGRSSKITPVSRYMGFATLKRGKYDEI